MAALHGLVQKSEEDLWRRGQWEEGESVLRHFPIIFRTIRAAEFGLERLSQEWYVAFQTAGRIEQRRAETWALCSGFCGMQ